MTKFFIEFAPDNGGEETLQDKEKNDRGGEEILEIPEWLCRKIRGEAPQKHPLPNVNDAVKLANIHQQIRIAGVLYQNRIDVFLLFLDGLDWDEEGLIELENSTYQEIIREGIFNFEDKLEGLLLEICEFLMQRKIRAEYVRKIGVKKMLGKYDNGEIQERVKLQMADLANQITQALSQSKRRKMASPCNDVFQKIEMREALKQLINLYIEN